MNSKILTRLVSETIPILFSHKKGFLCINSCGRLLPLPVLQFHPLLILEKGDTSCQTR